MLRLSNLRDKLDLCNCVDWYCIRDPAYKPASLELVVHPSCLVSAIGCELPLCFLKLMSELAHG